MLMKLLKLVPGRRWSNIAEATPAVTGARQTADTERRYREIYGEDKLNQQLLYERWVVKDTWHLRNEALPLLYGINPDAYKDSGKRGAEEAAINELWAHARHCIEQGLLQSANREQRAEDWRVEPLQIYQWALVCRLQLPEPFIALMEFIGRTVKKSPQVVVSDGTLDGGLISAAFDEEREKVLGMALSVLVNTPERCRNADGKVAAELVIKVMKEQPGFQAHTGMLADSTIRDLLNKYI